MEVQYVPLSYFVKCNETKLCTVECYNVDVLKYLAFVIDEDCVNNNVKLKKLYIKKLSICLKRKVIYF